MQPDTILVIDDDPAVLTTVTDILQFEGYRVITAVNGVEGLRCLEQGTPALILLDMRMPVMDGWEFMRQLYQRGLKLPVVVMTAAQDARRWAEDVGATSYLAKPFQLFDLLTVVERLHGPSGAASAV
jgi:CheY-like chemotaxis protein